MKAETSVGAILRWILYHVIAVPVLHLLSRIVFGLKIEGREHLHHLWGAVLVCNHIHYLDSAMIAAAARGRHVTFATLNQNFDLPIAGWLLRQFGCVPVGESLVEVRAFLNRAQVLLSKGEFVGIFPEGKLEEYCPRLQKFQRGAFLLAVRAGVPVVPMALVQRPVEWYHQFFHRKPFLTLRIAAPIFPPKEGTEKEKAFILCRKAYEEMSVLIQDENSVPMMEEA